MKTKYEDWIEDYIDGTLSESEVAKFETELATNEVLKNEYEERLKLATMWQQANTYEKTRNEVIEAIQEQNGKRKIWIRRFSIAASVLIVVSLSVVYIFTGENKQSGQVAENEKPLVPKIKLPEEKASGGVITTVTLLSPANDTICKRNDNIIFKWNPSLKDSSTFIIIDIVSQKQVFKQKIAPMESSYMLNKKSLSVGSYQWYINEHNKKEKFRITE